MAFAFPCRLLFAGECEVLHYRIRCDELPEEKSERCPVETALVLKSTLRCSQGDRRYHSGSICFALTLLRERELNDE